MAIDTGKIRNITRDILYGSGLGEKPSIVTTAASPSVSVSGKSITFTLSVDDGAKLRAGDVLSVHAPSSSSSAFAFYIVSITADTVTCINGYDGSPAATSSDLVSVFLEVMPLVTDFKIFAMIDSIIDKFLWPEVFDMDTASVTPDLTSGQVNLNARDEEILHAWQKVGSTLYPVSFHMEKKMDTSLFASGVMGSFDFIDASTLYYAAKRRINTSESSSSAALESMVASGAAALSLGATRVETTLDSSKKDSLDRGERDVSGTLWRDFLTQKQVFSEDLSRDTVMHFVVER